MGGVNQVFWQVCGFFSVSANQSSGQRRSSYSLWCLYCPSSSFSSAPYARCVRPGRRRGLADQSVLHFGGRGARVRERLAQGRWVWRERRERRASRGDGGAQWGISGAGAVRIGVVGGRGEAGQARGRGVVVVVVVVMVGVVVRRGRGLIGGGTIPPGGRRR